MPDELPASAYDGFWPWVRGETDTIGGSTVISGETLPADPGWNPGGFFDPISRIIIDAAAAAKDTADKAANTYANTMGKAVGQMVGVAVILGVGYLIYKDLSSRATRRS